MWASQPGIRTSKWGPGPKALKAYTIWALVLYWKIIFGEQIHNCSKIFLFNKLIYKSPSYASTRCIYPSFLIAAWLTTILSSVSALFYRKMLEKANLLLKTAHYQMKKGRSWRWTFQRFFKALGGFHQANFSNLTNVFVSVIALPLKLIIRISFSFFGIKRDRITLTKLFPILDGRWTRHLNNDCLFVQSSLWTFLTERLDAIDKTWFYIIIFYCPINRKRSDMRNFFKNCFDW